MGFYSKKAVLFSHGDCPDGATSIVLARHIFTDLAWFPVEHKEIDRKALEEAGNLPPGSCFLMVDICVSRPVLDQIAAVLRTKECVIKIFEHHQSRLWLRDYCLSPGVTGEIIFDKAVCGSMLFFNKFNTEFPELRKYRELIELVNDRDLWLNQDERSALIYRLHKIYGDEGFINRFYENAAVTFTEKEKILLDYQQQLDQRQIDSLLKKLQISTDSNGFRMGYIYGEASSSELLNKAVRDFDLEYALLINMNTGRVSARGRGNFDLAAFAASFGGGGHKAASAFYIKIKKPQITDTKG
ncbi:MAG TPA: hypothetical protein VKS21_07800 [Spirochaetota bacterium]|nr:hypothetical protein [Spirochaetota bacterium]